MNALQKWYAKNFTGRLYNSCRPADTETGANGTVTTVVLS